MGRCQHPRTFPAGPTGISNEFVGSRALMSDIQETIRATVEGNHVVLFMKGSKNFPQCGFSARAVDILKKCGADFKDVNVLTDPALRQGIKDFSSWPTIPQLYVGGKFLGGSDIVTEMFQSGELQKLLAPQT